ncbi:Cell fate regulator YaaT, PSP1 superfamily (controls sporulation, competence, biofilm development) [Lutibacter oricola]|uniref:Cell fate regulator YaaT, PSP1 superfamily (Controls sporulation, competence, biofilm development) n=1 Tax=Lutibacter oricola TaxID=762486 RepID=A0A1H2R218_9FLAO|nr:regulatory iron-sulfur-containing complex subunit RicT [Lutibacter oricola]SDW12914.1 Cell fate regulator YaaT, PSP1 superfamily (controls sporulation, competence, biofilm development) [Lutibacter oricola]
MSCNSCSSDINTVPKGCKSNGNCSTGSCDKLTVFDWLSNMAMPTGHKPLNIVEVSFKNGRKHFYRNNDGLKISIGDVLAVEGNPGHDIGTVSLTGELIKVQLKKKGVSIDSEDIKKIYRKATQKDIDIWKSVRDKEYDTQYKGREIISRLGLKMKLSDVEYQGDGNKATFYYTADDRVDFRQLIRDLAGAFSIRVEMKQVGLRQEAARLGGVGSCGRELCCSTWLTDLRKVNTAAARYQQLSLNPQKLAGQCGKLKCCLNFELDTYLDALTGFPKHDVVLNTEKGPAVFIKMDIFKELLWYTYKNERAKWFKLTLDQVKEIIEANKNDEVISSLEDYETEEAVVQKVEFEDVVGQDSLTRFDAPKRKNKGKRKNRRKNPNQKKVNNQNKQGQQNQQADSKKRPIRKKPNRPKKAGNSTNKQGNQNPQGNKKAQPNKGNNPNASANKPAQNKNNKRRRPPKKNNNNNSNA